MELKSPWVCDICRGLEPLGSFHTVHPSTYQVNDSLFIEAPSTIDCIEKDLIKSIDLGTVFGSIARRFIDGFEGDHA